MTIVVGYGAERGGRGVLHLAAALARSAGDELILCTVVPAPWPPSPAKVDAEYRAELDRTAREAVDHARAQLAADVVATTRVQHARSVPAGLLEAAQQHDADLIVVGSSSAGVFGHVALGSVSSRLTHSSPVPVSLPPRGYRCKPADRVTRVTVAFGGSEGADDVVASAAGFGARLGASLRLASFAVRPRPPFTSGVGREGEEAMIEQWVEEIGAAGRAALEKAGGLEAASRQPELVIGRGESWAEALEDVEWRNGDMLLVGSSSTGPIARVFLGSRSSKIVRDSPVPVVVFPR
ncbi:MAG TPA: universal stress protein [Thermoleophilaceae bacterium]|nr:universal stress protein [Candidatus Dormibacteraeota bacterium]HYN52193.1 universal stress protein [Thermoleophilaceae bacterium]